jgi:hypothetical protein
MIQKQFYSTPLETDQAERQRDKIVGNFYRARLRLSRSDPKARQKEG